MALLVVVEELTVVTSDCEAVVEVLEEAESLTGAESGESDVWSTVVGARTLACWTREQENSVNSWLLTGMEFYKLMIELKTKKLKTNQKYLK